jgi:hypothetical protein
MTYIKNMFKSYKCSFCGFKKYYISAPFLSDKRNIIADNCPECSLGSMIIDLDDEINFDDNYLEKYYDSMIEVLNKGGFSANL